MANILVVDDRAINRQLLVTLLGYGGHRLLEAADGAEALALVRTEHPDLVISDIVMPTMDGYAFVQQLRADPALAATQVIFYTATHRVREVQARATAYGVLHVLAKPAEPEVILSTVQTALKRAPSTCLSPIDSPSGPSLQRIKPGGKIRISHDLSTAQAISLRLVALVELGLDLLLERDPLRMLDALCYTARRIIGARYAALGLFDLDEHTFQHFLVYGVEDVPLSEVAGLALDRGLGQRLLHERQPLRLTTLSDTQAAGFAAGHPPVGAFLGVPIVTADHVLGILYFVDRLGAAEFNSEDEWIAMTLAAETALLYENTQLYNLMQQHAVTLQLEVNERKQAEAALRQSEERYRKLVDLSPYAIFINRQDRVAYVNPACLRLFGATQSTQLLGQSPFALFQADFHPLVRERSVRLVETLDQAPPFEDKIVRLDGCTVDVEVAITAYQGGEGAAIQVILTDITERKQTAELLERRVEERTRELERRQRVSDGLSHIFTMLNSNHPLPEILDRILTQTSELMGAAASAIFQLQPNPQQPSIQASHGFSMQDLDQLGQRIHAVDANNFSALTRKPFVISDLTQFIGAQFLDIDEPQVQTPQRWLWTHGYRAVLGVPLMLKGDIYGALVLCYKSMRTFSEEDIALALTFSHQAALALENEQLRSQLERSAIAAERSRIARDLHDEVTQTLFAASIMADVLPNLWQRDEQEGKRRLEELRILMRGAMAEMRTLLLELLPTKLLEVEIADLLRQLAEATRGRGLVLVAVEIEGEAQCPDDVKIVLYRIAQEALNNIVKHAQAQHVQIRLQCMPDFVALTVTDNGRGFVIENIMPQNLGLTIMRERAEVIGASLYVQSQPEHGTVISVRWSSLKGTHPAYLPEDTKAAQ